MTIPSLADLLGQIDELRAAIVEMQHNAAETPLGEPGAPRTDANGDLKLTDAEVKRVLQTVEETLTDPTARESGYTVVFALVEKQTGKEAQSLVASQSEAEISAKIVEDDDLSSFATAFSYPARLRLLRTFIGGARTTAELTKATGLAGGQLYHHLRELTSRGFVSRDKHGIHSLTQLGKTAYLGLNLLASTAKKYEERRKIRDHEGTRD